MKRRFYDETIRLEVESVRLLGRDRVAMAAVTGLIARCWSILLGFFEQLIDLGVVVVMRINNPPHEWLDDRLAPP